MGKPHSERDGEESNLRACADCGIESPPTHTEFTLISSKYGWRLSRVVDPDGKKRLVWRCPDCWRRFKETGGKL